RRVGHASYGDPPRRERAGRRRRDRGVAQGRGERGSRIAVSLFGNKYPPEVAARIPPGQRLVKTWPILHFGPVPRFDESGWDFTHCDGGYTSDLSLEAMLDDDVLVAWGHGGQPLEPDHGFPLRLVVPKRYAWKSAKWLRGLEFSDRNKRGFWEERGYHIHADPWREERYSYQEEPGSDTEP